MDRLQKLLDGRKVDVRDPITKEKVNHATERARLNNADRYFNQRIYDNEIKQANLYNQVVMPDTGKDVSIGFKINTYAIRMTQLLGFKEEIEKMLTNYFAGKPSLQKLRGTTREAQTATDFFKKGEIIATYNELMTYIKTYAQNIINDSSFQAQIYNSAFNPLSQLLQDTARLYPAFFQNENFPPPRNVGRPDEDKSDRKIYETFREQSIGCYSTFMCMADYINNLIFRPIVKEDVAKYIKDNNVNAIFSRNALAPPPLQVPQILDPALQPPQPQPQPQGNIPQPQPQPPQPQYFVPSQANILEKVEEYQRSLNPPRYLLSNTSATTANTDINGVFSLIGAQNIDPSPNATSIATIKNRIKTVIENIRTQVKNGQDGKGPNPNFPIIAVESGANKLESARQYAIDNNLPMPGFNPALQPPSPPLQPQPAPGQQGQQQGGPAQPVSPPLQPLPAPAGPAQGGLPGTLREKIEQRYAPDDPLTSTGRVMGIVDLNGKLTQGLTAVEAGDVYAIVRDIVVVIKQLENQKQRVLNGDNEADVNEVFTGIPQQTMTNFSRLFNTEKRQKSLIRKIIRAMRDLRIGERDILATDDNRPDYTTNNDERTLWGLGRHAERNNNLAMNAVFDFENMARRKAQHTDIPTITDITPQMAGYEEQLAHLITKLNLDRRLEPSTYGKGPTQHRQGIVQRAIGMPNIMEYDPKAEALKRGIVMSGGCDSCGMRGGMSNYEYYGAGSIDNEEDTPFKRMIIGMPNPFSKEIVPESGGNFMPYDSRFSDEEDEDYYNEVVSGEGNHYVELEKPYDLDEHADTIRKNNENYKVMTGKLKNVKYKN